LSDFKSDLRSTIRLALKSHAKNRANFMLQDYNFVITLVY
jgi:hypothetical protein